MKSLFAAVKLTCPLFLCKFDIGEVSLICFLKIIAHPWKRIIQGMKWFLEVEQTIHLKKIKQHISLSCSRGSSKKLPFLLVLLNVHISRAVRSSFFLLHINSSSSAPSICFLIQLCFSRSVLQMLDTDTVIDVLRRLKRKAMATALLRLWIPSKLVARKIGSVSLPQKFVKRAWELFSTGIG